MNNKILIKKNKLETKTKEYITIKQNSIIFKKDGDYALEYTDCDNISLDIYISDGVNINLSIFSKENSLKIHNHYVLGTHSSLYLFQFYDYKNTTENSIVDLNGEFSKFEQKFSSIVHEKMEYNMIVNHNKKNVISDITNKCIGKDNSTITIKIDSVLEKGNIDCIMEQNSRILTLGDVNAKIIPNMFIEENNVEARHGSIISSFDEEEVFYLMSRGISREESINLLIKGFLFSNMKADLEKREFIMNSILNMRR